MKIELQGERVELLAERAAFWERKSTLLIADTHWGKAATLRSAAIPVPGGTTSEDLDRLSKVVRRTGARRIVLLGDAIHARAGRAPKTLAAVARWRACHPDLELVLVRGNHDRQAGDPPASLRIRCLQAPEIEPPFVFQHFPAPSEHGYALAGHTHPAIKLRGIAGERATVPCFYFTPAFGVLPAFGGLTGCALIRPSNEEKVYGIAGEEVIAIL